MSCFTIIYIINFSASNYSICFRRQSYDIYLLKLFIYFFFENSAIAPAVTTGLWKPSCLEKNLHPWRRSKLEEDVDYRSLARWIIKI